MNLGDLVDELSKLPRDGVPYVMVRGLGVSKLTGVAVVTAEPLPNSGCDHCDDISELDPDFFKTRVHLLVDPDSQINKLMAAIDALVEAAPDKKDAIRIKSNAGIYLSPDEIEVLADPW